MGERTHNNLVGGLERVVSPLRQDSRLSQACLLRCLRNTRSRSHATTVPSRDNFHRNQRQANRCHTPLSKYALTRICYIEYIKRMESFFEIIAEPNRRAILSLLVSSQQSVGEIERQLRMSQPTVSKHLRVLRDAGFVESTVDAQRRLYRLKPEPFQQLDAWLAPFRQLWSAHLDALERHLDRMEQSTPTKRKTRRRRREGNRERDSQSRDHDCP